MDDKKIYALLLLAVILIPANASAELPKNYEECTALVVQGIRTDTINDYMSELSCTLDIYPGGDYESNKAHFLCSKIPGDQTPMMNCRLTFHNPDYSFPKSFEECLQWKRSVSQQTIDGRPELCYIRLAFPENDYDQEAVEAVKRNCVESGGDLTVEACSYWNKE